MPFKPQRWIPKNSEIFEHPKGLGVCYLVAPDAAAGRRANFQVVAYSGKRTKRDFNWSFRDRAAAEGWIETRFEDLTASQKYKIERRAERKTRIPDPNNPTLAETAQLVREALAQAFPKTKFSVRSESYSMGCSIHVNWTDGPTDRQVQPILDAFERCGFDGMQDLKTYHGPSLYKGRVMNFGADYVQGSRHTSIELLKAAALRVAFECDLPLLKISDEGTVEGGGDRIDFRYFHQGDEEGICGDTYQGEQYSQLIYQVARATSLEAMQPVELPVIKSDDKPKDETPASRFEPVMRKMTNDFIN